MRLPRVFATVWAWIALCVVIRLIALLVIPLQNRAFLNREMPASNHTAVSYLEFLQRRTDISPLTEDEHCYDEMARNICGGRGFVTDNVWVITTPGQPAMYGGCAYPLFVAGSYLLFGAGNELPVFLLQIFLQGAALWFVFQSAKQIAGEAAAALASAFFCFHPVLIWLSVAMMSETLLVPGVAALIWLLSRPATAFTSVMLGFLLAVMALTRSTAAPFILVAAGWLVMRKQWRLVPPLVMTFVLVCAPWTVRNYKHWNRFIPFSTKSGVNAWFFNHPGLKVEFGRAAVEGSQPIDIFDPQIQGLPDEAARNDRLMQMFREFLRENPQKFAGLCWMRFWMALLPARITSTTTGALISALYAKGIPLALLLALLIMRPRLPGALMFPFLLAAYWQAIQTLAGPGLRYRLPVEPAWAIIVGVAGAALIAMLIAKCRCQPVPPSRPRS